MKKIILLSLGIVCAAGCFTISQSDYPAVQMSPVTDGVKIQLEGFLTSVIDYTPVYATGTYVAGGPWVGPHHHHPYGAPYVGTYTTATYMPTLRNTDMFLERARGNLEKAGCLLRATPAAYTVSCTFGGPTYEETTALKSASVFILSILSARFERLAYTAEVKVYDTATGKLVFSQSYVQGYYASGWSPIPIFGIMDFEKVHDGYMKSWCLSALTDRVTSDVSAFLAANKARK